MWGVQRGLCHQCFLCLNFASQMLLEALKDISVRVGTAWLFWLVTSSQSPNLCIVTWCAVNIGNGMDYISHPRAANLNIKLCSSKEPCPEDYDNYSAPFVLEYKVQNKPTAFLATDTTCQIRMAQGRTMPER